MHERTVGRLHVAACTTVRTRAQDMGTERATGFSLASGCDINFCVATSLGWGMLVLGRDMIFMSGQG